MVTFDNKKVKVTNMHPGTQVLNLIQKCFVHWYEVTKKKTLITEKQKFGSYIEIHLPGCSDSKEST